MANDENLIPAKKGEVRNPKGKPKGTLNWSTVVKRLLDDEEFYQKILATNKKSPEWLKYIPTKNAAHAIASAMMVKAMSGDKKAADWLRKTGFGDKVDVTTDGKPLNVALVEFVDGNNKDQDTDTN